MLPNRSNRRAVVPLVAAAFVLPASAAAHQPAAGGAAVVPDPPAVSSLKCATGDRSSCPRGEYLSIRGEGLRTVNAVVFVGGRGAADDSQVRPRRRSPHRVLVEVPADAATGRVRVVSRVAGHDTTGRRLEVVGEEPAAAPTAEAGVFPVSGSHSFGTGTNRFGGGRGHQGQDIFATCGTPIVAAVGGEVTLATYHSRAGHYAVVTADDGTSQAYMHMLRKPLVKAGQRVEAGAPLGSVGQSGSAQGCHLHFELWTAPGWYRGGQPIDPLPALRRWEAGG
jgi:murein DD-endopeptidase MepM/ murein hydrolase activator NlpD